MYKLNRRSTLAATILSISGTFTTVMFGPAEMVLAQPASPPAETTAPPVSLSGARLNQLGKAYRVSPGSESWRQFLNEFKQYLSQANVASSGGSKIIKENPTLKDLDVKLLDVGGGRIWFFPKGQDKSVLFLQIGTSVETLEYPANINLNDARLVRSVTTTTKVVKVGRRRIQKKVVSASGPRYLILAGNNRLSGRIWLQAFKPYNGAWIVTNDPFSAIPPYLLNNVSGTVTFAGNNIVLAVSASDSKDSKLPKPNSTSYGITLVANGGKYSLAGATNSSQPSSIITQFVQCLRNNRVDLAKAWLHDPTLISIPKYIDLIGHKSDPAYKLVAMATPKTGGPRFRLVTHRKHDLIIDVGSKYNRLAIKALFIAPPDPLADKLSGTSIGPAPVQNPPQTETKG